MVNQYGSYILLQVNLPEFTDEKIICKINGGNPLIPLFEYTGEHTIKECVICGNKFVAYGNAKTCGGLKCRKKLEKQTKDKCNKNVV